MNTDSNLSFEISTTKGRSSPNNGSSAMDESDLIADLYQEYKDLVNALKERSLRRDPELLMRLSLVMRDLGLSPPSSPP